MVTPLAIVAGVVVVVGPVVVAATTPADRPPAAARPSTNSTRSPAFLIPRESLARLPVLAPRLSVVSTKPGVALDRRSGWLPDQGRGWRLAQRDSGRQVGVSAGSPGWS